MSVIVSPLLSLGVWALVAVTGSFVSSFILLCLSWAHEHSKGPRPRGLKSLPAVKVHGDSAQKQKPEDAAVAKPSEDEEEDVTPTAVLTEPVPEEMHATSTAEEEAEVPEASTLPADIIAPCVQPQYLLPPRIEGDPRRLTVVLDLDETLVRSCEAEEVPMQLDFAASMGLLKRYVRLSMPPLESSGVGHGVRVDDDSFSLLGSRLRAWILREALRRGSCRFSVPESTSS